jgi:hypothetical protein
VACSERLRQLAPAEEADDDKDGDDDDDDNDDDDDDDDNDDDDKKAKKEQAKTAKEQEKGATANDPAGAMARATLFARERRCDIAHAPSSLARHRL